ncbi:MAG: efflux RND transporter permease subunit, partial [Planctomycetota bacterium]
MTEPSRRTPFWLRLSLHRPVTVLMVLLSLGVVGLLAYRSVPLQLAPDGFTEQNLSVQIPALDSTPQEVMEQIAEPAEELLRTITGLSQIRSTSESDWCSIQIQYGSDRDGDDVYAEVRDRMERLLPTLPEGSDRYQIFRFNLDTDLPVVQMAITYGDDVVDPDALLDNVVRPRLEGVDGVAKVEIRGLVVRSVAIELIPELVEAYAVDVRQLIQRLNGDNLIAPGGVVQEDHRRYLLRMATQFGSLDEIRDYRVSGSLRLGDIATVEYKRGLQNFLVRVNGRLCRTVQISKESEANTLETCRAIEDELAQLPNDPRLASFEYFPYFNQGTIISASIDTLRESCAWGGLLAILVLYVFLRRVRITIVVAAAIPLSLLVAVVVIFFSGGTFNVLSMTGLTLGIGMLIDNAIVIAENIFRFRSRGESATRAAELGVREVGLAVTLATLTTVAVFLPIIFLSGESNAQVLLGELGLPVCYSVVASLLVALVVIPLATTYLRDRVTQDSASEQLSWLVARYRATLRWVLRHRFAGVIVALLALGTTMIPMKVLEDQDRNKAKTRSARVRVSCPPHFGLAEVDDVMETLRAAIAPLKETLKVENMVAWFGRSGGMFAFFLLPEGATTSEAFMDRLRPHVPEIPGVEIRLGDGGGGDEEKKTWIRARGRDPRVLVDLLDQTARILRADPGVLATLTAADESNDEVQVDIRREQAQRFAVNPDTVANLVSWALRGAPLRDYHEEDSELPFSIRYLGSEIESLGALGKVSVFSDRGSQVALANVANFSVAKGVPSIRRRNGRVESDMELVLAPGTSERQVVARAYQVFSQLDVPEGYELVLEDSRRGEEESFRELMQAAL